MMKKCTNIIRLVNEVEYNNRNNYNSIKYKDC